MTNASPADIAHLEHAIALARAARDRGDHPFGSVVVAPDGTVVDGLNSVVTQTDPTGHAETNVVRAAGARLDAATLAASVLYTSTEPCAMCAGAIYWAGISRVVYAFGEDELRNLVHAQEGIPTLALPCREVFARGGRTIDVIGPVSLEAARTVHEGFWGMTRTIIEGGYVATVDHDGTEHSRGYVVIDDGVITQVGAGRAVDDVRSGAEIVDATGCLVTPGLVNTHHHLYQWLTRGYAQDSILFDWLTALYPLWSRIDADLTRAGATGAMAVLARSGCTTVGDHHYIFPKGSGDIVGSIVESAQRIGVRLHATRGSMDLGASQGGLPPDFAVETTDAALAASQQSVERWHDPSFGSLVHVAIAPCSPFSVTADLLREAAVLARSLKVRLHTHASETIEEDAYCAEHFGKTPTQYLEDLGWLGDDVWMAHCVHLDDTAIARYAATGTGVAHCPSSNGRLAAGIAPVRDLLRAGVPVGLGVDGAASNESGQLGIEIRESVLMNRLRTGADSFSVRDGLRIATLGGARVLGRDTEIGSLEAGKIADIAVWRVDGVEHAGILDPVAALGLGAMPPLHRLFVGGRAIVVGGELVTAEEPIIAEEVAAASRELAARL